MDMSDARALNWQFVVPATTGSLLVLPVHDEQVPGAMVPSRTRQGLQAALAEGPYNEVVAADVSRWTADVSLPTPRLLAALAGAVAPGGHLYAGFPGRLYPLQAASRGPVLPVRVRSSLRRHGLQVVATFITLPTASCPALIVPVDSSAALDYVLRNLSFPYTSSSRPLLGRGRQALVRAIQAAAVHAPHRLRVAGAPGHAVLAVRPEATS
jgi:hypothetical protein